MYNLLIAGGASLLGYGLGAWAAGWIAGFVPALLVFIAAFFFLARRTGKQVETIFKLAMEQLQGGQMAVARATMESALPLGRWQILVEKQVEAQLGGLDYLEACSMMMQRQVTASRERFASAKAHLQKSWNRDWRARAMLAACQHRENDTNGADKTLAAAEGPASNEALFFGVWAYILNEARRRDEALQVVGRGLKGSPKSAGLIAVQEAMQNRKKPDFKAFGEPWYQFFPEHIPQEVLIEQARAAGKLPKNFAANQNLGPPQPHLGGRPR
ncbi:MAG: hypothetical protein FJ090_08385 [Deltaproteobacteria bacterium]|nr:hypothetical protein [Deltaproteobacteria bacterium]